MSLTLLYESLKKAIPRLPVRVLMGKHEIPVTIDALKETEEAIAYNMFNAAASQSGGIDREEVPIDTRGDFHQYLLGTFPFLLREADSGAPLGVSVQIPSPLQRSLTPRSHAGYYILHEDFAGRGLGGHMTLMHASLGAMCGYNDIVGRTSILSRGVKGMVMSGGAWYGNIPLSTREAGVGWRDDLIIVNYFSQTLAPMFHDRLTTPLQPLVSRARPAGRLVVAPRKHRFSCGQQVTLRSAAEDEAAAVHALFRAGARAGLGFSCEEFTEDGRFGGKLLQDVNVMVALDTDSGALVAGAVYGRSALCRSRSAPVAAGYVAVAEEYRQKGIGAEFYELFVKLCENEFDMDGVIGDVYVTDGPSLKMLHKLGFKVTGSIPHAARIAGREGLINDVILYKDLKPFDYSNLPGFKTFMDGIVS